VIGKSLATFQKSKNTWATVGSTSLPLASQAPTAGPSRSGGAEDPQEEDIKPDISEAQEKEKEKKSTTIRQGGLKTAAQIREEAAVVAAARAAALAEAEEEARASGSGSGQVATGSQAAQGQTVHRDSSGRIVDIEKLKKEAKEKEEEEKRKAREREEWSRGMVQRQAERDRARQEEEMARTDVAR
jgi:pre-mRNA-splicing factor CWC26